MTYVPFESFRRTHVHFDQKSQPYVCEKSAYRRPSPSALQLEILHNCRIAISTQQADAGSYWARVFNVYCALITADGVVSATNHSRCLFSQKLAAFCRRRETEQRKDVRFLFL